MRKALYFFFFFQAEDGIRDVAVTGVQTCALPICGQFRAGPRSGSYRRADRHRADGRPPAGGVARLAPHRDRARARDLERAAHVQDRKSTRLNSSHGYISYAVFCLKKKKKKM